jgi:hypothetical protein
MRKVKLLKNIFHGKMFCLLFIFLLPLAAQEIQDKKSEPDPEKKETPSKSPHLAALLGIVPGVGQAYVGNIYSAGMQAGTFLSLYNLERYYRHQPDYIDFKDREVKFDLADAVVGYQFQKNGWVYNDLPFKAAVENNEAYRRTQLCSYSLKQSMIEI